MTKNQQVASHVIAGANGPTGDHKNIIPGSIGSTDLHPGSVTAAKLNLPKFNVSMPDNGQTPVSTTLVAVDGLTLRLTCVDTADGHIDMGLSATSSKSGAKIRGTFDGLTNAGPILTGNVSADTNDYTLQDLSTTPVTLFDDTANYVSAALVELAVDPGQWFSEHDRTGRRLRQVEVRADGTSEATTARDWPLNPAGPGACQWWCDGVGGVPVGDPAKAHRTPTSTRPTPTGDDPRQ